MRIMYLFTHCNSLGLIRMTKVLNLPTFDASEFLKHYHEMFSSFCMHNIIYVNMNLIY